MGNHRSRDRNRQEGGAPRGAGMWPRPLEEPSSLLDCMSSFQELCVETGRAVLDQLMEEERESLCGAKGRHLGERSKWRAGSAPSQVTLGGARIEVQRLRVRGPEGEVRLESFEWAASRDAMDAHTMEAIASGVSTRNYVRTLDTAAPGASRRSASKSSVSRRFKALSAKQMEKFLSSSLEDEDVVAVYVDAKHFRDHCILIALGVLSSGRKLVLGLREGSTENSAVVRALLADLVERGLSTEKPLLFVIDGGKALRRAIAEVFGDLAVVQRCQVHKARNVEDHLPEGKRAPIRRAMRKAWDSKSAKTALKRLRQIASKLEREHPGAASSLREGMEETVTVLALGLQGALQRTLRSTNPIESLNGSVQLYTRNVKRWRGGSMIQRWVGAALLDAQGRFHRVRGYRDLPKLGQALQGPASAVDSTAKAA